MNNKNSIYCHDCQKILKNKIEIQLVDEHNKPISNMPYTLKNSKTTRKGTTDGNGMIREEQLLASPLRLFLSGQELADEMEKRPLRMKRNSEYTLSTDAMKAISPVFKESLESGRQYRYAKIGELVDKFPVIEKWKGEKPLPSYHFPDSEPQGLEVYPSYVGEYRYVIEVCPFRAWSLLLHHQKDYSLVNAYNLSLMSILTYANDDESYLGSVTHFFSKQLLDLSRSPHRINDQSFSPIVYDVPFSERYTEIVFVDSKKQTIPQGDTQLFYVANKKEIITGWRGTESGTDIITDLTFQPLGLGCTPKGVCSGFIENGKIHKGFWEGFHLINESKVLQFDKTIGTFDHIIKLVKGKKLFVCGHSLGGALALIHSAQLKSHNPCLYTYGMPRTFTQSAVQELADITHYRHVNENDTVPSVPFNKDMDNIAFQIGATPSGVLIELLDSPIAEEASKWYPSILAGRLVAKSFKLFSKNDDPFLHHGKLVYFYVSSYLESKPKLYLLPSLNEKTQKDTVEFIEQQAQSKTDQFRQQEISSLYPDNNENSADKGGLGALDHSSTLYSRYIDQRLRELCALPPDKKFQRPNEDLSFLESEPTSIRAMLDRKKVRKHYFLMEIDNQLASTLEVTRNDKIGSVALQRYSEKR
ncbi:lipase family protein [Xenorhabdus bovienii]|uniref:lipase family protein n=1 Tax=Xenorhabdus bovienii TaxID=40576 RepID=UPI00237C6A1C|nr:lipase family protein [Xenorhabdus bovienii]MDE1476628.1 lipase family protein [Xenorhabdus bovienii]